MAITLEKIYEVAIRNYHMQLQSGEKGLDRLVDWVHMVEEMDYVQFIKGRELIVTTGIIMPGEDKLLSFVENIYEMGASGLVINVGPYIGEVPEKLIQFSKEHDFPIFTLPWEVHLVEFNRELCNMIYHTEREQDTLESAVKKLIFSKDDVTDCLSVLEREEITEHTTTRMIQCYIPSIEEEKEKTQLYYDFQRHCQQILSKQKIKYILFFEDSYVTVVLFDVEINMIEKILAEIQHINKNEAIYLTVSGKDTSIYNLSEKYKKGRILCKKSELDKVHLCKEDESGVWKLLLDIEDQEKLRGYEEQILGELSHIDEEMGSIYCQILESYVEENGNIQVVAAQCFLHRNTVSSHLKHIGEIIGKDLNSAIDRNELYIAFQIRKILSLM